MAVSRPRPVNGKVVARKPVSHEKPPEDDEQDAASQDTTDDEVPAGRPPVDALSEMMASLQGAATSRITVYRIVKNQPQSYVFECDPASFSLDDLRDKYNGGEFRLYVMKDGRLFKNMRVVVEPKQIINPHEPQAPTASALADVMQVMRDGFTAQVAAMREASAVRSAGGLFSGQDLPAIISAVAAAITALRPAPAPPPPPAPDMSEKALDMFMRGLEIANTMRDSSGDGGGISGMLRDVLRSPIVAAAVQSTMHPNQTPPTPAQPQLLGPQQAAQQPAQVSHAKPAETVPHQEQNQVLKYYLGFLVGKAKSGADASLYAELVLDNVPDAQLTPMLTRGDALIDDLIAIHAPVAEHREWFLALLKEINELLNADDESDAQAGGSNATDTATDVVPGQLAA